MFINCYNGYFARKKKLYTYTNYLQKFTTTNLVFLYFPLPKHRKGKKEKKKFPRLQYTTQELV